MLQEIEDVRERKAVLLGERDVEAVVGSGSLQLEIEAAAETLAQRQSPGLVDASAERRVDDQLHAAAFVEETLGNDRVLRGHGAEDGASLQHVLDRLLGAGVDPARILLSARRRPRRQQAELCDNPNRRSVVRSGR